MPWPGPYGPEFGTPRGMPSEWHRIVGVVSAATPPPRGQASSTRFMLYRPAHRGSACTAPSDIDQLTLSLANGSSSVNFRPETANPSPEV